MTKRNKIVFLDLDGTLWKSEQVPSSAWTAIRQARACGHRIAIATGRKRDHIPAFLYEEDLDGYCLSAGMDLISHGKTIASYAMDPDAAKRVYSYMKENGIGGSLEIRDMAYDDDLYAAGRKVYLKNANRQEMMNRSSMSEMKDGHWNQLVKISYDGADLKDLQKVANENGMELFLYRNQYNPLDGIGGSLKGELTDIRYNKGSAISLLMDALHLKREDWQVIAVGDQENDLPMFEEADIAVCMGNGTPAALEAADVITDAIDQDGLYKAFEKLGLLEE